MSRQDLLFRPFFNLRYLALTPTCCVSVSGNTHHLDVDKATESHFEADLLDIE
jgi:hypothetical protein